MSTAMTVVFLGTLMGALALVPGCGSTSFTGSGKGGAKGKVPDRSETPAKPTGDDAASPPAETPPAATADAGKVETDTCTGKAADGDFRIVKAEHSACVRKNDGGRALALVWSGAPKFPVTVIYRKVADAPCPASITCGTVKQTFDECVNPLVLPKALYVSDNPGGATSSVGAKDHMPYEAVLVDADGETTTAAAAAFDSSPDCPDDAPGAAGGTTP